MSGLEEPNHSYDRSVWLKGVPIRVTIYRTGLFSGTPVKGHFTIAILNGFYNSGSGLFIIVKLLYIESKENENITITVPEMLMIWSTFIIFPVVKTFFFSPL